MSVKLPVAAGALKAHFRAENVIQSVRQQRALTWEWEPYLVLSFIDPGGRVGALGGVVAEDFSVLIGEIRARLDDYRARGLEMFATSSSTTI